MFERIETPTVTAMEPDAAVRPAGARSERAPRGTGWLLFAGVMIGLVRMLNAIYGIAAISDWTSS
jgi:hypothetical protein